VLSFVFGILVVIFSSTVDVIASSNVGNHFPETSIITFDAFGRKLTVLNDLIDETKNDSIINCELSALLERGISIRDTLGVCFSVGSFEKNRCNDLLEFEFAYSQAINGLYKYRIIIADMLVDRRDKIQACVDGLGYFLTPEFSPEMLAQMEVLDFSTTPYTEYTSKASWVVNKSINSVLLRKLNKRIVAWASTCTNVIFDAIKDPSSRDQGQKFALNEYFVAKANEYLLPRGYSVGDAGFYYNSKWNYNLEVDNVKVASYVFDISCMPHISFSDEFLGWDWNSKVHGNAEIKDFRHGVSITKQRLNDDFKYEHYMDQRDGREYKIVSYFGKRWFAENLNYDSKKSKCYDEDQNKCKRFGRLYTYDDAMISCPKGWHLPNLSEWRSIISNREKGDENRDDSGNDQDRPCYLASTMPNTREFSKINSLGFNVSGSGVYNGDGFEGANEFATYHSSDYSPESGDQILIEFEFGGAGGKIRSSALIPTARYSVRCVEN